MNIDIQTLFVVMVLNATLIGCVFVVSWFRERESRVPLLAGLSALQIAAGVSLLLLRDRVPAFVSVDLANDLSLTGLGTAWAAARNVVGRRGAWPVVFAGAFVWQAACLVPAFYEEIAYRLALTSLISAAYVFGSAFELLRPRIEVSGAVRGLGYLWLAHGTIVLGRALHALVGGPITDPFEGGMLHRILILEPVLMLVALSLFGVRIVRERTENELRRSAETDALTGVMNRGKFFATAERAVEAALSAGGRAALLVFDLDHFKALNDRYGHLAGDTALGAFAEVLRRSIRATDLVGRIGGEEFAVLLPGVDPTTANIIAERIRFDFGTEEILHEGAAIVATVSVGVATASTRDGDLRSLFAAADRALYEAKRGGRDRVENAMALAS